jgi:hypothetical protein
VESISGVRGLRMVGVCLRVMSEGGVVVWRALVGWRG